MPDADALKKLPKTILLSLHFYCWLLSLGPQEYQEEYLEPTLQVFLQCCRDAYRTKGTWGVLSLWPALFSEAIIGMIAEHLHLQRNLKEMQMVMRRSMIMTFSAFMLFFLGCATLLRLADPVAPFNALAALHTEIKLTYILINNGASVTLLIIVLGGLPFLFTACKNALIDHKSNPLRLFLLKPGKILALVGISLLIALAFIAYAILLSFLLGVQMLGTPGPAFPLPITILLVLLFILLISAFVFFLLLVTISLSLAIARSQFSERMLRFALIPITIAPVSMAITLLAALSWTTLIYIEAPAFARSSLGLGQGNLPWLFAALGALIIATAVSLLSLKQGLEARNISIVPSL